MPRVVHFEIHAENPERAIKFYTKLFGWEFSKWAGPMDYWLIKTGPDSQKGINGGLVRRQGTIDGRAVTAYVCTIDVSSSVVASGSWLGPTMVDEYSKKILAEGGTIVLPKMPIPGIGWLAYAKDTEGNIFGFMQTDPQAK
jgi:uncharacterized protein